MARSTGRFIMKRVRAKHGEMTLGELTGLILLLFFIIGILLSPIPKYIYNRIRNLPEPEIQYQFEHLTEDVMTLAVLPKDTAISVGFDVNNCKDKCDGQYKIRGIAECREKQTPEKDGCKPKASLCILDVLEKKRPICEEFNKASFEKDFEIIPQSTALALKKDSAGRIVLENSPAGNTVT